MDVILFIDMSNSIELPQYGGRPGRFQLLKDMVVRLVRSYDVSPTGTHFAMISYGSTPVVQFSFNRCVKVFLSENSLWEIGRGYW